METLVCLFKDDKYDFLISLLLHSFLGNLNAF